MSHSRIRTSTKGASVPLVALALLALPGCNREQPDQTNDDMPAVIESDEEASGENPYWDASNLCELVPVQDVAAAAGGTEPLRTEAGSSPPATCRYFFQAPDPYGPRNASATLQMMTGYSLERTGAGSAAQDVAGLGDDAWAQAHTDSYVLFVRRGDLVFSLNVAGVRDEARPAAARAIAEVVLAKL